MKKMIVAMSLLVASIASAGDIEYDENGNVKWQARSKVDTIQVCGTLTKEDTMHDGVQSVLAEKNQNGKVKQHLFLSAASEAVAETLKYLEKDAPVEACVIGIESKLMPLDSPHHFHAIDLII